jgi:hypothetical protein
MMVGRMNKLLTAALKNKKLAQSKQKRYYDQKRTEVKFEKDDLILIRNRTLSHAGKNISKSLEDKYVGPYVITEARDNGVCVIASPVTLKPKGIVNVVDVKRFVMDDTATKWPYNPDNEDENKLPSITEIPDDEGDAQSSANVNKGTDPSTVAPPPVKRKRGRPPKKSKQK